MAAVNLPARAGERAPWGIPAGKDAADVGLVSRVSSRALPAPQCAGPMAVGHGRLAPTHRHLDLELGAGIWAGSELGAGIWAGLEPRTRLRIQRDTLPAIVPRLDTAACSRRRVKSPLGWEMPPLD